MTDAQDVPPRRRSRHPSGRGASPLRARPERPADAPLVLAGGPATFLNPGPLAEFVDLFLIGEAEEMLPESLAVATGGAPSRERLLAVADGVRGAYRPDRYTPIYGESGDL